MSGKEATVIIVDVGKSMEEVNNGRQVSDLDYAMTFAWDRISNIVATGRKTLSIGVIALRTDETENERATDENYARISVIQPISQIQMQHLRHLKSSIHPSSTNLGDAISAIVIAITMLDSFCRHLKFTKEIILLTNGRSLCDVDDADQITQKLKDSDIKLTVLGVDFDDEEYGFTEKNKDRFKRINEASLSKFVEQAGGVIGTMEQAITDLQTPRVQEVKVVPNFKGILSLGGPDSETSMGISVERYPRVMVAKPQSASSFARTTPAGNGTSENGAALTQDRSQANVPGSMRSSGTLDHLDADPIAPIKFEYQYYVPDESAENGKRGVDKDALAQGYTYGATAVPISESDQNVTKLETAQGLELIGFLPADKFEPYMPMSTSYMIVGRSTDAKASVALSSLIHALHELQSFAVARFVQKDGKEPVFLLLAPHIEPNFECLIDTQIPFAEDLRKYRFPPIDRVVTTSGKVLKEHRNLPSSELNAAMSYFVDAMDISEDQDDEDMIQLESTYSPLIHRIKGAVSHRAIHPLSGLPPVLPILLRPSHPPALVLNAAQSFLRTLIDAAGVKKVDPKKKSRRRDRNRIKPLSGLDIDALLGKKPTSDVSFDDSNAIPQFKQFLESAVISSSEEATSATALIGKAAESFMKVISSLLPSNSKTFSTLAAEEQNKHLGRVVEHVRTLREQLIDYEEPDLWNDTFKALRSVFTASRKNLDMMETWSRLRRHRLGIVTKRTSEFSQAEVGAEEGEWDL